MTHRRYHHRRRANPARSSLFFLFQNLIVFLDECADLICHAQKLFPLLAIECSGKRPSPYTESAPFSLTFRDICPRAGLCNAWFSARSRAISAFSSSSDAMRFSDSTPRRGTEEILLFRKPLGRKMPIAPNSLDPVFSEAYQHCGYRQTLPRSLAADILAMIVGHSVSIIRIQTTLLIETTLWPEGCNTRWRERWFPWSSQL